MDIIKVNQKETKYLETLSSVGHDNKNGKQKKPLI